MGWLTDLLQEAKEVPISAVLRERVALAEQKYEGAMKENTDLKQRVRDLEGEIATLRAQLPNKKGGPLSEDAIRVLVHLFETETGQNTPDVDGVARGLQMQRSIVKYHLDCLEKADFAHAVGFLPADGRELWVITSDGRRYVVENKLR